MASISPIRVISARRETCFSSTSSRDPASPRAETASDRWMKSGSIRSSVPMGNRADSIAIASDSFFSPTVPVSSKTTVKTVYKDGKVVSSSTTSSGGASAKTTTSGATTTTTSF